jgi:hypothetical protein
MNHVDLTIIWGFLKMVDPQVTMGLNTVVWSSMTWMIWGILHFRKPSIDRVFTHHQTYGDIMYCTIHKCWLVISR